MSGETFRSRRFVPVPPEARPRRNRVAVRVLVTDGERLLMFADTDPGLAGTRWWFTPGGGLDPGETPRRAAVRELAEETGLAIVEGQLLGPIMTRTVVHGYSDQVLIQDETFFVLRVAAPFVPDVAGHTPEERLTLDGHAWHRLDDLAGLAEPVWPADPAALLRLLDDPSAWPVTHGRVEESTVPVSPPR